MSGKGDGYRPVDKKKYDDNFDRIFGQMRKFAEVCGSSDKGMRKSIKSPKGKG